MNAVEVGGIYCWFGSLQSLALASVDDLRKVKGIGRDKAVTLVAAFAWRTRWRASFRKNRRCSITRRNVVRLLRAQNLGEGMWRRFRSCYSNTRRQFDSSVEEITNGTLDTLLVHAREVFRSAIPPTLRHRARAQPPQWRSHAKRSRHQGHPRPHPRRATAQDRGVGSCDFGRATPERAKDYSSLRELGYFTPESLANRFVFRLTPVNLFAWLICQQPKLVALIPYSALRVRICRSCSHLCRGLGLRQSRRRERRGCDLFRPREVQRPDAGEQFHRG